MNRIPYIDSMRGLAMFMVVTSHLFTMCGLGDNFYNNVINEQLQLPIFFFISGFFAKRIVSGNILNNIANRFTQLFIPGILMMLLYCWIFNCELGEVSLDMWKHGYWFTFVLFYFFAIYAISNYIAKKLTKNDRLLDYFNIIIGIFIVVISFFPGRTIVGFLSLQLWSYYFFFVLGSLLFPLRDTLISNNKSLYINHLYEGIIILAVVGEICKYKYGIESFGDFAIIPNYITVSLVIIMIWKAFSMIQDINGNIVGKFLSFVGRRSLDVYLIHYFILPANLSVIAPYLSDNPLLSYLFAIILAIPITLAAIGIGSLIRISTITGKLLLGAK